jgi:hypothetical protein
MEPLLTGDMLAFLRDARKPPAEELVRRKISIVLSTALSESESESESEEECQLHFYVEAGLRRYVPLAYSDPEGGSEAEEDRSAFIWVTMYCSRSINEVERDVRFKHPFSRISAENRPYEKAYGMIVSDNVATRKIIDLISSEDGSFDCGTFYPAEYRARLIKCLDLLVD